jgi:adenosine deaminase
MKQERTDKKTLHEILYSIPKAEIHLHLEGLATVETIWQLKKKHAIKLNGITSREDLVRRFKVKGLNDFIDLFINVIQNCFRAEEDILYLIQDAQDYLERNNIVYAEIFFAPSKFVRNGFSFSHIVKLLDQGAEQIKKLSGREIKFLMDVSRSFGPKNAMQNLDLTLEHPKKSIIGIGLGGAESQGPAEDYKEVFQKAKEAGLHVVAHAGEDVGAESIWHALEDLQAERIGHGISAQHDEKLMAYLAKKQIPLEICPMSNIFTKKYVSSYEDHPIKLFFDRGIFVTVNTDDPTIFGAELIDEYANLIEHGIFDLDQALRLIQNTIEASFLPKTEKKRIVKLAAAQVLAK